MIAIFKIIYSLSNELIIFSFKIIKKGRIMKKKILILLNTIKSYRIKNKFCKKKFLLCLDFNKNLLKRRKKKKLYKILSKEIYRK